MTNMENNGQGDATHLQGHAPPFAWLGLLGAQAQGCHCGCRLQGNINNDNGSLPNSKLILLLAFWTRVGC